MTKPFELTEDDLGAVAYCDHEEFDPVTEEEIIAQGRWMTSFSRVFKHTPSGTFWRFGWDRGSTEQQDDGPENLYYVEVVPKEKTITVYEKK